jgi:hypothetical protein
MNNKEKACQKNLSQLSTVARLLFLALILSSCTAQIRSEKNISMIGPTESPAPILAAEIYVPLEGNGIGNVYQFHLDLTAPIETSVTYVQGSANLSVADSLRSLFQLQNGDMLSGAYNLTSADEINLNTGVIGNINLSGGGANAITGVHAGCGLPNGDIIAGDENVANGPNNVNEYDSTGEFVRTVYQPSGGTLHPGMISCVALSSTRFFMVVGQTYTAELSSGLDMTLVDGNWTISHTMDQTALDTRLGTSGSSLWMMALGQDGNVYYPPFSRPNGTIQNMIQCPESDITQTNCVLVGDIIPESLLNGSDDSTGVYGLVPIPGTEELLMSTFSNLYRYNITTGHYTLVYTYPANISAGGTDYPRGMVIQSN